MRWLAGFFIALSLASCNTVPVGKAVAPIPESEQSALALKILDSYRGTSESAQKLYLIYFTPADREPVPRFQQRLDAIFEDVRAFYRDGMEQRGFGPKTFALERDANDKLIIHVVKGKNDKAYYAKSWNDHYRIIGEECQPMFQACGISLETNTVAIICNLADWDADAHTFSHPAPYSGIWTRQSGLCWLMDSPILDMDDLLKKQPVVEDYQYGNVPLGKRNSMFIGSIAHELGHALGLPHSGERWDEKALGTSIMGMGNLKYHDELRGEDAGAFLNMASALRLAARPLFNSSSKGREHPAQLGECSVMLSTNVTRPDLAGKHGALRLEGLVQGAPPIYGVIAYFEYAHDGGYLSPAATSVPDAQGRFAIETCGLPPCTNGIVRVAFCHANGGISERRLKFKVTPDGRVDLAPK